MNHHGLTEVTKLDIKNSMGSIFKCVKNQCLQSMLEIAWEYVYIYVYIRIHTLE